MIQGRHLIAVVALSACAVTPAVSDAVVSRPDLLVKRGTVRATNGRLVGSFVVGNAGTRRSGRSYAALVIRASGRNRLVKRFYVSATGRGGARTVTVSVKLPTGLPVGALALRVCADSLAYVRERAEANNCRTVGSVTVVRQGGGGTAPINPEDSRPTAPVAFQKDTVFTLDSPESNYWIYVPSAYDSSHGTPITLLIWMHGCGGMGSGDIYVISPGGDQSYIGVSLGGREGACWDVNSDQPKVFAAIANVKSHFNINPHRVIIGGYSSGGDLAYRTAFYNANAFAGLIAENTTPFRDTGSSQANSIAAAAWKFHIVHLAHTEDEAYPIDGVRQETDALKNAGFPIIRVERPGTHYDEDKGDTGSDHDLRAFLLPHLTDDWVSP